MKFKIFIVVVTISILYTTIVFSQSKKTDSLIFALEHSKEDSAKVNNLNALAKEFRNTNTDTSLYFANKALELATKLNFDMGVADSKLRISALFASQGKFNEGIKYGNDALVIYNKLHAAAATKDLKNILAKISSAYLILGHNISSQGNNVEGLKNTLLSLKIKEQIGDKLGIGDANYNIGLFLATEENYPEALKYFNSSLKISEELGRTSDIATTYNTIGWVYIKLDNYSEASKHCFTALKLTEHTKDNSNLAEIYNNLGIINDHLGNYNTALNYDFAALNNYEVTGFREQIPWIYNNIASVYLHQKKYNKAAEFLNKALHISTVMGKTELIKLSYENWTILDSARGNYKQALNYYKLFIQYRDSLFNNANSKKIIQLQMQYDYDKREDSLKQKQFVTDTQLQVHKKQKYFYWTGLVLLGFLSIVVFHNFRNQMKINKLAADAHSKQKAELELQNHQAILKERLRISGELHDEVGATLSGISMYSHLTKEQIKKGETTEIEKSLNIMQESSTQMVDKLSDIVWLINPEQDSLEKLITRLEEYAIQMAAIKDMKVKINFPAKIADISLPVEHRRNIYLFCKEAINNAVKYSNATILELSVKEMEGKLKFSIGDNGKGFDSVMVRRGNGLENMQKRANEIGAKLFLESIENLGVLVSLQCNIT
ncbi:MAG: tetratricopeptide repeat protein [Saprospiraceae bacterium]